jgi:tetratricopeptide (TPR) repeat protein
MGDHDQALAEARKTVEQYPDDATALFLLGTSAALMGRYDEAIAAHEKMVAIDPGWLHALGSTYALAGRKSDAQRILAQLEAAPASSWGAFGLAELHTALGNTEQALHWLEYEPRHAFWGGIGRNPALKPLRNHPRFQALLQRVKRPD